MFEFILGVIATVLFLVVMSTLAINPRDEEDEE